MEAGSFPGVGCVQARGGREGLLRGAQPKCAERGAPFPSHPLARSTSCRPKPELPLVVALVHAGEERAVAVCQVALRVSAKDGRYVDHSRVAHRLGPFDLATQALPGRGLRGVCCP